MFSAKSKVLTFSVVACIFSAAFGQNPKHTNYYRAVEDVKTDYVLLDIKDPVSRMDFMKFRVKFTNSTSDFIRIEAGQTEFVIDGKIHNPKDRVFFLDPYDSKARTLQVDGGSTDYHVDALAVNFKGFARIPSKGQIIDAEDFPLPAQKNAITAGDFEINLKNISKETKVTWVTFEVKYTGKEYAIVDQSKISVRTEAGQVYASEKSKSKVEVLQAGDKTTIRSTFRIPAKVVDMQFANLTLLWNDCFMVSQAEVFDVPGVSFEIDLGLTAGKNK